MATVSLLSMDITATPSENRTFVRVRDKSRSVSGMSEEAIALESSDFIFNVAFSILLI